MIRVFISYSSRDRSFVQRLSDYLSRHNVDVRLDENILELGDSLPGKIFEIISKVEYVVAVISSHSVRSRWVIRELEAAITREINGSTKFVLPIRLGKCKMPSYLSSKYYAHYENDRDFNKVAEKVLGVITKNQLYLGRMGRVEVIKGALKKTIAECEKQKNPGKTIIRMRATLTSMSNISHLEGKGIDGLLPWQEKKLDKLLEEERRLTIKLINKPHILLKCICWPRAHFLSSETYSKEQRKQRLNRLRKFLNDSLRNHLTHRQIVCDRAAGYGNLLLIGKRTAIVAPPQALGYTKTFESEDAMTVGTLVREYDKLFNRIWDSKSQYGLLSSEDIQKQFLLKEAIALVGNELEEL